MDLSRTEMIVQLIKDTDHLIGPENEVYAWVQEMYKKLDCDNPIVKQDLREKHATVQHKSPKPQKLVPQLLELLRQCLLTHRWKEVSKILTAIIMEKNTQATISHIAFECFLQDPMQNISGLKELTKVLRCFKDFHPIEITLEFFLCMLLYQNTEEIEMMCRGGLKGSHRECPEQPTPEQQMVFNAYVGLVHYVEWKHLISGINTEEEPTDEDEMAYEEDNIERLLQLAVEGIEPILEKSSNVWDVFLKPYTELLAFTEDYDKLEFFLQDYCRRNYNNPYPLKLLYEFYRTNRLDSPENRINVLKKLYDKNSFNDIALVYYGELQEFGRAHSETLPILFKLLDFSRWLDSQRVWTLLRDELRAIANEGLQEDDVATVKRCWEPREDWWEAFHFGGIDWYDRKEVDMDLLVLKATASVWFMGTENLYCACLLESELVGADHKTTIEREIEQCLMQTSRGRLFPY